MREGAEEAGNPAYRIGVAAGLLEVSVDTVRRWADSGRLRTRRTEGGQRLVDGTDLARLAMELAAERESGEPDRREAADELGLAPGMLAVAVVKSTNVVVEVVEVP